MYKYSRKEIVKKIKQPDGYYASLDLINDLLAKEEDKHYCGHSEKERIGTRFGDNMEKICLTCGLKIKQEDKIKCEHEWNQYGSQCIKCGKLNIVNVSTPSPLDLIEEIHPILSKDRLSCYNSKKEIVSKINEIISYLKKL